LVLAKVRASEAATKGRVQAAEERAREAHMRDELARRRDEAAAARDRVADERDRELDADTLRAQAASDRASAAADRRLAARDRERASLERREMLEALRCAHFDDLTGAHRRGFGEDVLRSEIERARRADGRLVVAFVDVDGLKEVNDREGHMAGDRLLQDVVESIRANIRSYEPIIRLGGDEFAFAVAGLDTEAMGERCAVIRAELLRRPSGGHITIGVAELEPGDELEDLLERADAALVRARARRVAGSGAAAQLS
jgi:diguanylate cyclase (GGDEF)-like protein